jgi:putative transcriptional regulator
MKKRYKNTHYEAIHSAAVGLFKIGAINAEEMREYDEACFAKPAAPVPHPVAQNVAVMYAHGK